MSKLDGDKGDKRDFTRLSIGAQVALRANGMAWIGRCHDLSCNGLQVQVASQMSVGDELAIHLPSRHAQFPDFNARATVVRTEALPNGEQLLGLLITQKK